VGWAPFTNTSLSNFDLFWTQALSTLERALRAAEHVSKTTNNRLNYCIAKVVCLATARSKASERTSSP